MNEYIYRSKKEVAVIKIVAPNDDYAFAKLVRLVQNSEEWQLTHMEYIP